MGQESYADGATPFYAFIRRRIDTLLAQQKQQAQLQPKEERRNKRPGVPNVSPKSNENQMCLKYLSTTPKVCKPSRFVAVYWSAAILC
jgi:hypothetical protein